jgi:hypothetical protein
LREESRVPGGWHSHARARAGGPDFQHDVEDAPEPERAGGGLDAAGPVVIGGDVPAQALDRFEAAPEQRFHRRLAVGKEARIGARDFAILEIVQDVGDRPLLSPVGYGLAAIEDERVHGRGAQPCQGDEMRRIVGVGGDIDDGRHRQPIPGTGQREIEKGQRAEQGDKAGALAVTGVAAGGLPQPDKGAGQRSQAQSRGRHDQLQARCEGQPVQAHGGNRRCCEQQGENQGGEGGPRGKSLKAHDGSPNDAAT